MQGTFESWTRGVSFTFALELVHFALFEFHHWYASAFVWYVSRPACGSIAVGQHLDMFQSSRDRSGKKGIAGKNDRM